jgi:Gpi18-like mannosyltransferase
MNPAAGQQRTWLVPDTLAAAAIMVCAALVFFMTHGYATHGNFVAAHWDANFYYQIARHGYHSAHDQTLAFLPGYSILLIPATRLFAHHPFIASFVTSSILSVLGGAVLYRLLRLRLDIGTSLAGIALFAFSPFAIYFFNGYSEAAFLLAAALALLWLATDDPLPAAFAAGYALIWRPYALALLPLFLPIAWQLLRARDFWRLGRMITLGALPILAYAGYLYYAFGDPFLPWKTLSLWHKYQSISHAWPRPVRTLYAFYFAYRNNAPGSWALALFIYFVTACATLVASARLPRQLVVYSVLVLACVYLTDALIPVNLGRHELLAFAASPAIAAIVYMDRHATPWQRVAAHAAFAMAFLFSIGTFIVMSMRFSAGLWVS